MNIKPNFSELSRIYGIDRRTIKNTMMVMKESLKLEINQASWINT